VKESFWEKGARKDASAKSLGSCNRVKRRVCAKKGKGVFIVEGREKGGTGICRGPIKKRVYSTFQITPNITSTLCGKKGWDTEDGIRLLTHKSVDNKKWIPLASHCRYIRWSRKEEVFIKLDLRWGYNNVRIKEGDEWKVAFIMHIGAYEPTVIYFGLTNSPATFQTMMNDLFHDLINQGDTATFIDDILVATDTKEGHDGLVEEVLKRLEENDLFVKPKKCELKVREVEFLGVVIGPKGVEMQK